MSNANDTLTQTIVAETGFPICVVSVLVGLSLPLRQMFIAFCNAQKATLISEKAILVGQSQAADIVAKKLAAVATAGRAALAPVDTILNAIPFQQMAQNCPLFGQQFTQLLDNVPVTVPVNPVTQALGVDGFDVFAGVNSYATLRNRLDELTFRIDRALTVSDRVNKISSDIDRSINSLDMYLTILSKAQ